MGKADDKILFKTLFEQTPVSTQIFSMDGTSFMVNRAWERLWKSSARRAKSYNILEDEKLKKLGIMPYVKRAFEGKVVTVPPVKYELTKTKLKKGDIPYRWFSARMYPIKSKTGEVCHVILQHDDITKQKKLEREKNDFLSLASHELKTPLTSVKMFVSLLQKQSVIQADGTARQYTRKLRTQVDRLIELTTDLLDLSRIETGKMRLSKARFRLDELVTDTVEGLAPSMKHHPIHITKMTKATVYGDRYRLYQVLVNFLTNASKYSEVGKHILVSVSKAGGSVRVSVKDLGKGIEKEKQKNIFKRHVQLEEKDRHSFFGLGLGLFISKEIIEKHRGKIGVRSEVGKGSTFYFTLPVVGSKQGS